MDIKRIDDKTFNVLTQVETIYNIDDIRNQIDTLNKRVAQEISNGQEDIKRRIQVSIDEIARLQELLDAAAAKGIDIPNTVTADASVLIEGLETTKQAALDIASPQPPEIAIEMDIASSSPSKI